VRQKTFYFTKQIYKILAVVDAETNCSDIAKCPDVAAGIFLLA
jgi:hypothetical protein